MNTYPTVTRLPKSYDERLVTAARLGCQKSIDQLVLSNMSVVKATAKKMHTGKVPFDDMIQEGVLGVLKSIKTFATVNDCSFYTYCRFSVMDHIFKLISERETTINIGQTMSKTIWNVEAANDTYLDRFGRPATDQELANATGENLSRIRVLQKHSLCMHPSSLSLLADDEDSASWQLGVEDNPVKTIAAEQRTEYVARCIAELRPREQEIIGRFFGLAPYNRMNLWDIGEELGVGESRVSQIVKDVLEKLNIKMRKGKTHDNR